ncbi:MAG TPA: hypothetical protein VJP76_06410, partial [Candidatus Tumulicola sp.]|nr:hypothetical protein [Candidatus Tumulicola sp.]
SERAMREAIVAQSLARTPRLRGATQWALCDDALLRFERLVTRAAPDGVRPAILFAERDRIVSELRRFLGGRLAARLFAVRRADVVSIGRDAVPFDAVVRGRRGGIYGVVFRRLCGDGRKLETMRAIRRAARTYAGAELRGVLVYDFTAGTIRTLRCGTRAVELAAA